MIKLMIVVGFIFTLVLGILIGQLFCEKDLNSKSVSNISSESTVSDEMKTVLEDADIFTPSNEFSSLALNCINCAKKK